MAGGAEQVGDRIMDGDKALQMALRLEAFHDPFSSSDWLMRIIRPVVQAFVGAMLDARHNLALRSGVGSKLVGDHHARRAPLALQRFVRQTPGRLGISAALHKHLDVFRRSI